MASRDVTDDLRRGTRRPVIDIQGVTDALDDGADAYSGAVDRSSANISARQQISNSAQTSSAFEPAEFALNAQTGEIALPNGEKIKANAPTIVALATLKNDDGRAIPKMKAVPEGFRPISQQQLQEMVKNTPTESDFWGQALAAGQTTLGLIGSAIDSMFGNDDPSNSWSRAQQDHANDQTLGQFKASQGRWYSGANEFLTALGETAGNIGGNVVGALPVAAGTAVAAGGTSGGVGAVPGGALGLGLGLSGGASAYGEQATQFYDESLQAMQGMSPETLERESPLYRRVVRENPGISHEEAIKEVAIQGARVAGTTAGSLGALEGMVGGKLAGNVMAKMGVSRALFGAPTVASSAAGSASRAAGRTIGRALAGGVGAGAEEMAESMLGQAAGAAYTGVGNADPMSHMDIEEGIQASLGGLILGGLGGGHRSNRSAAEVLEASDLGQALKSNTSLDSAAQQAEWSRPTAIPEDVLNTTAASRRELGQRIEGAGTAMPAPDQRDQVLGQLDAVLSERYGPDWQNQTEAIARDPQGRQLLGQVMGIQREIQQEQTQQGQLDEVPAYERGYGPNQPGEPRLRGPAFGDETLTLDGGPQQTVQPSAPVQPQQALDPAQQALPGIAEVGPQPQRAAADDGTRAPLNLRERRAAQLMQQEEARAASEANPAALGVRDSRSTEQEIFTTEDEIAQLQEQIEIRPARDPRKKFLRQSLAEAKARLRDLEARWQEETLAEGPQGIQQPGTQVDAPEPAGSETAERTPDGRPIGVAPAPLVNPEPMHPEERRQRSLTQLKRRQQTTAATATQQASGAQVEQAAAASREQVSPSTAEPARDIQAQLQDLADPAAGRDAVFVAAGDPNAKVVLADENLRSLPPGVKVINRKEGTLFTTDEGKARRFQMGRINDETVQKILGYSQNKADAIEAGSEPVVVQAKTKDGAVVAEQLASREQVPAARAAVKKIARKGAKVSETTPAAMQAERAAPKALQRPREAAPKAKKSLKKPAKDDDRRPGPSEAQIEAGNYRKRHVSVDGLDIAVETEVGQSRRPEWPALKNAYGYIKRTLGRDGDHVDVFLGPKADQPGNVYVIDQNHANGQFDEHKVMLGFDSLDAARRGYLANYGRGQNERIAKVTAMEWGEFKQWVRDGKLTAERTRVESSNALTFSERAAQTGDTVADAANSIASVVGKAAARRADTIRANGRVHTLPERLTTTSGQRGSTVDLTTEAVNDGARMALGRLLDGEQLSATDRAKAEAAMRDFQQLDTMLDAAVKQAEARMLADPETASLLDAETARQLEVENKASEGSRGRPRETPRSSPLAYMPLSAAEVRGFLRSLRAEAKAELLAGAPEGQSLVRQMLTAFDARYAAAMAGDVRNRRSVLQVLATLSDADLRELASTNAQNLYHSTVAKQVMRGATEVAHAMARMQRDLNAARTMTNWGDHLSSAEDVRKTPHTTEHAGIPEAARGLVNEWVSQFEKGGNKFSAPVHVVSMQEAVKNYPQAFIKGIPNGKFLRLADDAGKTTHYVLAMDWGRFQTTEAAVEVLAHEYGHMTTLEMYGRADPRTRAAIDRAYDGWLQRQYGRRLTDILRDQMPGYERMMFKASTEQTFDGQPTYATDFWEWSARNAALYVLNPNRPHLTAVEKFFAKVGSILRGLYQSLTGAPQTDAAWAQTMDRWIDGTSEVRPMPAFPSQFFNHEEFAEGTKPPGDIVGAREAVRSQTSALSGLKNLLSGNATAAQVEQAMASATKGTAMHTLKRLGLSLLTLRQIEQQYRDTPLGKPLSSWVRNQQLKAKEANSTMEAGSRVMEQANLLDAKVRHELERMMYYATHFAVHPDLPITDKANKHLLQGNDRVKAEMEKRYNHVRDLYERLSRADARVPEIYAGLRDEFTKLNDRTLDLMLQNIQDGDFSQRVKDDMTQRIKDTRSEYRRGPYFPMMRFGKWIVNVNLPSRQIAKPDGSGWANKTQIRDELRTQRALNPGANISIEGEPGDYYLRVSQRGTYFYESEAQANAARAEIEAEVRQFYAQNDVSFDKVNEGMAEEGKAIIEQPFNARDDYAETKQGSAEFMKEVRALVNEKKMDPEVAATLERLAVEGLPENSYRQALLPRQNIFGASKQMLRAYAHRYQGASYNYASVMYSKQINKAWADAWKVNRTYSPAGRVLNTLESGQKAIADRIKPSTGNTVMNAITDASSLFSLGFSPAYVLTNSLQPMMVTAPVLAGMVNPVTGKAVGMLKAGKYLADAYKGAVPHFTKRGIHDFISETKALLGQRGETPTLEQTARGILDKFAQSAEERAMLASLLDRGTLDFSWLNSLEDAMRGGAAAQRWAALQRLAMAMPQQVEAMNRVTTALAAMRLAKAENLTDGSLSQLSDFADETVANTQLDYSRMNRPLAFNKAGLNVILQFKLYMQGMYMLFVRNAANAMATVHNTPLQEGETPAQHLERIKQLRIAGRRTMGYLLAMHGAVGGMTGLGPVSAAAQLALSAFAFMFGGEDDEWKSGEQLQRELLAEIFGEDNAVLANKGLPALIGVDMSDRIGLPMLVDSRFMNIRETDSASTGLDKFLLYSLGAPYSNFRRVVAGSSDLVHGDLRNAVNGLPASVRAIARSGKWAAEGIVDRDGDTFVPRSEMGWGTIGISALGLQPVSISEKYQQRTELKGTSARIMQERIQLVRDHNAGKDNAAAIAKFNASAPKPFRISAEQLSAASKSKAKRDAGERNKQEAAVAKLLGQD